ncbi:MAG: ATP-binding cassette domain-containing protein [Acidimicrobiaceae bacterium]|nr:ATP-binding cassette domain-containing protein [Acidimicrobiaceae bacterium]
MTPLLEVTDVQISYRPRRGLVSRLVRALRSDTTEPVPAVRDASFTINPGETVALVGESGSGKTTLARSIAGLIPPQRGSLRFEGADITRPVHRRPPELLRHIQYVFQNPASSLNPRRKVRYSLGRTLDVFFKLSGAERRARMAELLASVHLDPGYIDRYPPQLSGGEAQRVAIAQALAAEPKLILCDEVLSALDVSVQDNILELLRELQAARDVAYLFIAHDLAVVRWLADRVVVLYHGRIVEQGTVEEIFTPPHHPYTALLLDSIPGKGEHHVSALAEDASTVGTAPDAGCAFEPRCQHRIAGVCEVDEPPRLQDSPTHDVLCHLSAGDRAQVQVGGAAAAAATTGVPSQEIS